MRSLQVLPPASSQMAWTQDELSRVVLRLHLGAPLHMAMRGDELLHGRCWQHCALMHGQRMSRRLELENGQRALAEVHQHLQVDRIRVARQPRVEPPEEGPAAASPRDQAAKLFALSDAQARNTKGLPP
eukprot:CAMPEP_0119094168 /NCGR_PEP_ID=MMETSP1178-20130426/165362_1 /TAXON_ID=33656 /ORGANISM="unid sp, Strain CCMP2000" /LENGTH=128 /DNA_ID=CAMNT_0007077881 /DNA_START=136 /DNA_END=520 /DNA_ORIENTATION=-